MSKKKEITIPLSKIVYILVIVFVLSQMFSPNKKENESENKQGDTAAAVAVAPQPQPQAQQQQQPQPQAQKKQTSSRMSRMSFDDVAKSLEQFPPNLAQGSDTAKWQRGEIIRYFSIDTALQRRTENMVRRARTRYGAAVAINPYTGQILAMVSQQDPELPKIAENLALSSEFPAASIIKTITAEAAFENISDISAATEMNFVGRSTTLFKRQFFPEEHGDYATETSFAEAFARSNNPIFARLAIHNIGREKLALSAQKFGWNSKIPFELPVDVSFFPETTADNLSDTINLAFLGSGYTNETTLTPLLGALIASAVVNRGSMMRPTLVDSIVDISGRKLYEAKPRRWKNSAAADIADSLKILMQATARIGSARNSFADMRTFVRGKEITYGGKTGTKSSQHGRNEWFIGYAHDADNNFAIATSVCFTQHAKFILRPSQVSADIMLDHLRRTRRQINEKRIKNEE